MVFDSGVSRGIGIQMNGFLKFSEAGKYGMMALSNDGIRVQICGKTILTDPNVHSDRFSPQAVLDIPKPGWYPVMIQYFQRKGTAAIEMHWKLPGKSDFSVIPAEAYAHTPDFRRRVMTMQEGVVQFNLTFLPADPLPAAMLGSLNAWRQILYRLGLIGQDPHRYGGLGFGNVSIRMESGNNASFIISGTQTGGMDRLSPEHYTLVKTFDPATNSVVAEGVVRPSSESLTHGSLYRLDQTIRRGDSCAFTGDLEPGGCDRNSGNPPECPLWNA